MVRSYWKGTLVLTLAWVGAARSQPAPPGPARAPVAPARQAPERLLSIQEEGKPAQKCRVLTSWKLDDGTIAHQVQAVETGEISTIIDGPKPRVFAWGKQNSPPAGTPTPPYHATRPQTPQASPVVPAGGTQGQPGATAAAVEPAEYRTIQEHGKAAQKCRVLRKWQMSNGLTACEVQSLDNNEIMTLEEMGAPSTAPGSRVKAVATRIFHWGRHRTPPAGVPMPPAFAQQPVKATPPAAVAQVPPTVTPPAGVAPAPKVTPPAAVAQVPPKVTPPPAPVQAPPKVNPPAVTQAPQVASPPRPPAAAPSPPARPEPVQMAQAKSGPPAPAAPPAKPAVEPAKPTDVRKSWGGPDEVKTLPKPPASPSLPRPPASTTVKDEGAKDPLANPRDFASKTVEEKLPTFKPREEVKPLPPQPSPVQTVSVKPPVKPREEVKPLPPPQPSPVQTVSVKPQVPTAAGLASGTTLAAVPASPPPPPVKVSGPAPAPSVPPPPARPAPVQPAPVQPAPAPHVGNPVPLGAQSVLAANSGLERPIQYVPVPIVTVPQPNQPPMPPVPAIPQAPQSNQFVNAFSTPQQLQQMQQGQQGGPPMMAGRMPMGATMPGYGPMPGQGAMVPGYPPMAGQGRMTTQGYAAMVQPQQPGYGYAMSQPGQPPMQYVTYPQYPQYQQMPARGSVPYGYQGPQAPNPYGQQVATPMPQMPQMMLPGQVPTMPMPAPGMQPMPTMPVYPGAAQQGGMTADQAATANAVQQMVHVLKTSGYPSQREWAANNLATCDYRAHPQVVQALTAAATEDPAPTVRAGCAYNLARMKVTSEPVMATLRQLKSDADPRVRQEAEQALARLAPVPVQAPVAGQPAPGLVQPAGGVNRPQ